MSLVNVQITAESKDLHTLNHEISYTEDGVEIIVLPSKVHLDMAIELYAESLELDPARRELVAKKVLRKLDFILLPMMCIVYLLSYLDKLTLNYASAYGLKADLHLVGRDYSWVAAASNFGYLLGSYPATIALQKLPMGILVGSMLVGWGAILMLIVAARSFAAIFVLRFILGILEACIAPAWMTLTSMFWTRKEQGFRMSWWLSTAGWAQIIGAGASWGLGHTSGALSPWQLIFLVIGILSIVCGGIAVFLLPSGPNECVFFNHEEAVVAVWRVAENRTGVKHTKLEWYQIQEALRDPKVYCIAGSAICLGTIQGAVSNFATALYKGFGFSSLQSLLYQLPAGAFTIIAVIVAGLVTTIFRNTRSVMIVMGLVPAIAGMIGIATISIDHQTALAACAWLQYTVTASIIVTWSLITANVAGHTKRTFVNGLEFVFYSAGAIIGPFLFLPNEAPRYLTAIKTLAGLEGAAILFTVLIAAFMFRENRKRNEQTLSAEEANRAGFADHTDGENKGFIYGL